MAEVKLPEQFRPLAEQLEQQGWSVEATANNHLKWQAPDGAVVISSSTPSDHRARQRLVSELRRTGAVIDGRGATREDEEEERPGGPVPAAAPPPSPPEPAPAVPPEPDGLRDLVTEARQLLSDLRAARYAIERLLDEDVSSMITAEVREQFVQVDIMQLVKAAMDGLHEASERQLDGIARDAGKALRAFDRRYEARVHDLEDLLTGLQAIRGVWEERASGAPFHAVPPAFLSGK